MRFLTSATLQSYLLPKVTLSQNALFELGKISRVSGVGPNVNYAAESDSELNNINVRRNHTTPFFAKSQY
ncbi:MAG: hypothetical protein ACRCV3_02070 [Desulfovibrionaceae bacterium]